MKKTFFKLMLIFLTTLLLLNALSLNSHAEGQSEFDGTQKSIDSYINGQLDKVNIDEIQKYLSEDDVLNDVDLKTFIKDLLKEKRIYLIYLAKMALRYCYLTSLKRA